MSHASGTEFEIHDPENTLTPRQSQVLVWVIEGKENAAIGTLLGITAGTVKFHMIRLLQMFEAPNRQLLISRAFAKGLARARQLAIGLLIAGSALNGANESPFTVRTPRVSQVRSTRRRDPDDSPIIQPVTHALFTVEREAA